MKKHTLLLAATLLLLQAFAQKTDVNKKLLTGTWNLRYFGNTDFVIDADNQLQTVTQRVKVVMAQAKDHILSEKDSAELVKQTYLQCRQVDSSTFQFNADRTAQLLFYLPIDGEAGTVKKATYYWVDDTHLMLDFGDDKTQLTVLVLNDKRFEARANDDKDPGERITLKLAK